jgi:hypothetical protein
MSKETKFNRSMVDVRDLKCSKKIKLLIAHMQGDLMDAQHMLDDLARSVEIAQITRQYQVTEVFVEQSQEMLKERRWILPEADSTAESMNIHVFEGEADKDLVNSVRDKIVKDGIKRTGPVNSDNVKRAADQIYKDITS